MESQAALETERSAARHGSDAFAMGISAGLSALAGLIGWLIVAQLVPQSEFGAASAFVSGFLLVSGLTELNLGVALLRWLPSAGRRAVTLVRRSTVALVVLGALGAGVYLLFPGSDLIVRVVEPAVPWYLGALLFVATTAAWSALHLQDFSFVGTGHPWWSVGKNVVLTAARLVALLTVGTAGFPGAVVWAWAGSTIATAMVMTGVSVWLGRRTAPHLDHPGRLPGWRDVIGFLGPTYVGTLALTVLYNLIPLIVIVRMGTVRGGAFFVAWQSITVVDVVATYFVSSLVGAVAREPGRTPELLVVARRRLLVVFVPALGAGALLADPVLHIFGPGYATAAPALQVLLAGMALRLLVVHAMAARQAVGDARGFAVLSVLTTGLVLVGALLVPAQGYPSLGTEPLMSVAITYIVAQVASVALLWLLGSRSGRSRNRVRTDRPTSMPAEDQRRFQ